MCSSEFFIEQKIEPINIEIINSSNRFHGKENSERISMVDQCHHCPMIHRQHFYEYAILISFILFAFHLSSSLLSPISPFSSICTVCYSTFFPRNSIRNSHFVWFWYGFSNFNFYFYCMCILCTFEFSQRLKAVFVRDLRWQKRSEYKEKRMRKCWAQEE